MPDETSPVQPDPNTQPQPTSETPQSEAAPAPASPVSDTAPVGVPAPVQPASQATASGPVGAAPSDGSLNGPFPDELRHWNWGAFLLSWIWGIGNNVWIALLTFLPVGNIVMPFVLGAKGNEWAWQHRKFESVDHFKAVQKAWTKWGLGLLIAAVLLWIIGIAFIIITGATAITTGSHALQSPGSTLERGTVDTNSSPSDLESGTTDQSTDSSSIDDTSVSPVATP